MHGQKEIDEFENNSRGIELFFKEYKNSLHKSLCILDTTGGHEIKLLYTLCNKKISVHHANTRKVKNFIRSYCNAVKTDRFDVMALAKFG